MYLEVEQYACSCVYDVANTILLFPPSFDVCRSSIIFEYLKMDRITDLVDKRSEQVSIEEGDGKALRKIAAALPGMDTLSSTSQQDMVEVVLKREAKSSQIEQQGGGCACEIHYLE
ncbi:OLC1v1001030C1 [Oldenlandia corymbosa var. corymbosa]|uniref:OLC1v1001030C1 n=1 Tax=Oldenlandia corymbosa var. corymbosa TaxID=529605 RepID=A0AAV1D761_OLDCO|nr:OLC1v1001030C1 [Oldenlandia corymbosa var. corymbosa]